MNKIILVLIPLLALCFAEPPSSYGAPSFSTFSSGGSGGYDDGGNEGDLYVDSELLARVAQILEQSESRSRSSSRSFSQPRSEYGAPPPSDSYGPPAPSPARFGSSSGVRLGQPERAERIAEFDLSSRSTSGGFRSSGGYSDGYN